MYSLEQVKTFMRNGGGCDPVSVAGIGNSGGGSTESQHREAIDFWEKALALEGADALQEHQRVVAERELARHQAAIVPPKEVNRYGPPPDYFGQPV